MFGYNNQFDAQNYFTASLNQSVNISLCKAINNIAEFY